MHFELSCTWSKIYHFQSCEPESRGCILNRKYPDQTTVYTKGEGTQIHIQFKWLHRSLHVAGGPLLLRRAQSSFPDFPFSKSGILKQIKKWLKDIVKFQILQTS